MNQFKLYLVLAIVLSFSASLYAGNTWPAWRGPEFTGIAPDSNPPTVWSETQNIKWKVKLTGDASSGSPIVWKDKIFFQTAVKTDKVAKEAPSVSAGIDRSLPVPSAPISKPAQTTPPPPPAAPEMAPPPGQGGQQTPPPPPGGPQGQRPPRRPGGPGGDIKPPTNIYQFNVVCMDRATGKVLWEKTACESLPSQGHHPDHGFASFSPVTDGKYVWAYFGPEGMYCFDFDGKLVWKKDMPKMKTTFGEAGSPALAGDAVVVVADTDIESWIFAFNKTTGDILWKNKRDEKTSYAAPVVAKVDGKLQVITGASKVRSYDAKTGALIWETGKAVTNDIPTPVVGFDAVFCTSGGRGSGRVQVIKLYKEAPADPNAVLWQTKDVAPQIASPLLYGRRLYVFSANPSRLSCFDAKTGNVLFAKQPLDLFKDKNAYASPVGAADKVYMTGRNGMTYVLKNADTFEVLSTNQLDDVFDGTPAIVDNEIILKGKQSIYCITEKK
jgi:outer membrane protein assembly factor BamB